MKILKKSSGVTLIELLIALAILGIVMAATMSVFFFGQRTYSTGTDQFSAQSEARIASDYLVNQVRFATRLGLVTRPSNPENPSGLDQEFNYFFLHNGRIYHLEGQGENQGFSTRTFGRNISGINIIGSADELEVQITGVEKGQTYNLMSKINLVNISMNPDESVSLTGDENAIKYSKSPEFALDVGSLPSEGDETVDDPVAVTGVSVSPTSVTLQLGQSMNLSATVSPSDATNKNVTWKSNNESVVKVDTIGRITADGVGTATVTVTTSDGSHTATSSVEVEGSSEPVRLPTPTATLSKSAQNRTLTVHGTAGATVNLMGINESKLIPDTGSVSFRMQANQYNDIDGIYLSRPGWENSQTIDKPE